MPGTTRKRTGIQSVYTSLRSSYFAPSILRTARSWSLIVTTNGSLRSSGRSSSGFCGPTRSARIVSPSRVT